MDGTRTSIAPASSERCSGPAHEFRNRFALLALAMMCAGPADARALPASREAQCIDASARYYSLPVALLRAVREQEGGVVGQWRVNTDGSVDYGVMQINSRWLPRLERAGYTASVLTYDACASIAVGAWILAQALASRDAWNRPDSNPERYWRGVGEYHSHTPHRNRAYAEHVWARYQREGRR